MSTTREQIFAGQVVDLGVETFDAPGGRRFSIEVVRHPGGAAIAAVNDAREVCLVRQYRHAAGGWLIELPAGKIDSQTEPPVETARRELREEAGLEAKHWQDLGQMVSTPGFCDEVIYLYLATSLTHVPTAHEDGEIIEVFWLALGDACAQALSGEITDAKTITALLRADAALR